MAHTAFDAEDWIDRLGASLDSLAADVKFSFSSDDGQGPYLTVDQVRALQEGARSSSTIADTKIPNGVQWSGTLALDKPLAILRDHPELLRTLKSAGEDEGLLFLFPHQTDVVSSKDLVLRLLKRTALSTGHETARLLNRYLTEGAARQLEAREFVVIYGLKLAGRIGLGNGAFLAPLDDRFISEEGFTDEEADKLKSYGAGSEEFRNQSGGSSVFVRDLKWGPGVAPGSDGQNAEMAEISHSFPYGVETVVILLSIASRCPLATSARHIRAPAWMHEIHTISRFGGWSSATLRLDGWWEEQALSSEAEDRFERLMAAWPRFQFASDREHDAFMLAVWRLWRSFSRIGGWELQDRILDYAIALEILYRPDKNEVTYTLSTRAAWLLGKTPQQRRTIFDKVTRFYAIRSGIVHGSTSRKRKKIPLESIEQACANGRELACDSLLELLERGRFPDWKALVLDAPAAPTPHSSAGGNLQT